MQGSNPPQNCTQAFSKEGDQIFTNRNYTAEQSRSSFLSGDVEEEIRWVCKVLGSCTTDLETREDKPSVKMSLFLPPHRHLQREIENQSAQANRFKQQMRKLDEDIKQNDGLLRRAHTEQKTAKVTILSLTNQCSLPP